jgi:L-threonylcarbamoyladenylate synthase
LEKYSTRIVDGTQDEAIAQAAALLLAGEVVALPTETVYGLAGNALDSVAVAKIFSAKMRPAFDPLIVHVAGVDSIEPLVRMTGPVRHQVERLTRQFWPGPLTLLLVRTPAVADSVTAGLETVAIRAPAHRVFRQVLQATQVPLAAPSANRFGRVSPTAAAHVMAELQGQIPLILDGGATRIGLESTIVRPTGERLEILRPGPITAEALSGFGEVVYLSSPAASSPVEAPGQLPSHYAPNRPVILIDDPDQVTRPQRAALLVWGALPDNRDFSFIASLSESRDLAEAGARLFRLLREADDRPEVDAIYVQRVPEEGLGTAIMNRLRRAAAKREA